MEGFDVLQTPNVCFIKSESLMFSLKIKQQNVYLDFNVNWLNLTCCLDSASCGRGGSIDNDAKVGKVKRFALNTNQNLRLTNLSRSLIYFLYSTYDQCHRWDERIEFKMHRLISWWKIDYILFIVLENAENYLYYLLSNISELDPEGG